MNKFKKILLGVASVLTLGALFAVTSVVNAMNVTNNNKTATWTTSDMDGMLQLGNSPTSFDSTKSYVGATSFNIKTYVTLIPVPSASSAGSLTITANGTKNDRYCYLIDNTTNAADTTLSFVMNGTPSNNFTSANVLSYNNAYYVGLIAYDGSSRYDFKASQFVVTLTSDDSYVSQVKVSYYLQGSSTAISSNNISSGDTLTPSITCWGKTITGYYSDSSCTIAWDSTSQITSDTSVYCKYTDWTMNGNALDVDLISKGYDTYGNTTSDKADRALSGTIYTLLKGNTRFESTSEMTVSSEIGKASHAIYTGGGFSDENIKNGLRIQPTKSGTLSMYVYSGTDRALTMYDSSSTEIDAGQTTGKNTMTLVTYHLDANETYDFGAGGAFYIYYTEFVADMADGTTASVFAEKNASGDTLRFIGTLTGITDLASIDTIELILEKDGVATKKQIFLTTCYTSVVGTSQTCAQADGTYYTIYRITGITGLTGTISKQLKVTFTDGSTTLSDVTEIVLA